MTGHTLGRDTRVHRRAFIELSVACRSSSRPIYTQNISKGGTFIKTENPLPIGSRFAFKLQVPPYEVPLELAGEVMWARPAGKQPGMGVRFVFGSDAQKSAVESAVENLLTVLMGSP